MATRLTITQEGRLYKSNSATITEGGKVCIQAEFPGAKGYSRVDVLLRNSAEEGYVNIGSMDSKFGKPIMFEVNMYGGQQFVPQSSENFTASYATE